MTPARVTSCDLRRAAPTGSCASIGCRAIVRLISAPVSAHRLSVERTSSRRFAEGGEVRRKTGEQTLVSTKRLTGMVGGGRTTDSDICFEW